MGWKYQVDPVTGKWLFCICRSRANKGLHKQDVLQTQVEKHLILDLTVMLMHSGLTSCKTFFKPMTHCTARVHEKPVTTCRFGKAWGEVNDVRYFISKLKTTDLSQNYHLVVSLVCFSGRASKNSTLRFVNHPKKQKNRAITHISTKQNHQTQKRFNRSEWVQKHLNHAFLAFSVLERPCMEMCKINKLINKNWAKWLKKYLI